MKKIGIDYYLIEHRLIDVIRICKQNNLDCFDVKVRKQGIQIAFLIKERKRIKQIFPQARFLYTSGLLGMLLRNFTNKTRLISYLSVILLWCFFTNTLFAVNIYGESDVLDKKIQTTLKDYLYKPKDTQAMKTMLYKKYHDKISWLEVYEKGSSISIRYALKKQVEKQVNDNMPLIAKKDGMIAYFQCNAGYKLKKVNDIVKAGDVLVDNHMPNSFNQSVP
ncbi:MAG: hypothetical protein EOM50_08920, partial [Erysipelotrichia bacterium]|nr:hypothetical protein [Erysipelotrichia bacterium]